MISSYKSQEIVCVHMCIILYNYVYIYTCICFKNHICFLKPTKSYTTFNDMRLQQHWNQGVFSCCRLQVTVAVQARKDPGEISSLPNFLYRSYVKLPEVKNRKLGWNESATWFFSNQPIIQNLQNPSHVLSQNPVGCLQNSGTRYTTPHVYVIIICPINIV